MMTHAPDHVMAFVTCAAPLHHCTPLLNCTLPEPALTHSGIAWLTQRTYPSPAKIKHKSALRRAHQTAVRHIQCNDCILQRPIQPEHNHTCRLTDTNKLHTCVTSSDCRPALRQQTEISLKGQCWQYQQAVLLHCTCQQTNSNCRHHHQEPLTAAYSCYLCC